MKLNKAAQENQAVKNPMLNIIEQNVILCIKTWITNNRTEQIDYVIHDILGFVIKFILKTNPHH